MIKLFLFLLGCFFSAASIYAFEIAFRLNAYRVCCYIVVYWFLFIVIIQGCVLN